jgi:hypothetical protein
MVSQEKKNGTVPSSLLRRKLRNVIVQDIHSVNEPHRRKQLQRLLFGTKPRIHVLKRQEH